MNGLKSKAKVGDYVKVIKIVEIEGNSIVPKTNGKFDYTVGDILQIVAPDFTILSPINKILYERMEDCAAYCADVIGEDGNYKILMNNEYAVLEGYIPNGTEKNFSTPLACSYNEVHRRAEVGEYVQIIKVPTNYNESDEDESDDCDEEDFDYRIGDILKIVPKAEGVEYPHYGTEEPWQYLFDYEYNVLEGYIPPTGEVKPKIGDTVLVKNCIATVSEVLDYSNSDCKVVFETGIANRVLYSYYYTNEEVRVLDVEKLSVEVVGGNNYSAAIIRNSETGEIILAKGAKCAYHDSPSYIVGLQEAFNKLFIPE